MNTAPSHIALPELPTFTTLGETLNVQKYVGTHEGAQQTGRKLGQEMAAKIKQVFPEMEAGAVLVVAKIVGANLASPLKYATAEDRLALFGGRFRREVLFTVMHELVRADLDFSLVDSRGKKRPHPRAKGALHISDDTRTDQGHSLNLQVENLDGLGAFSILRRYPLLVLERLLEAKA